VEPFVGRSRTPRLELHVRRPVAEGAQLGLLGANLLQHDFEVELEQLVLPAQGLHLAPGLALGPLGRLHGLGAGRAVGHAPRPQPPRPPPPPLLIYARNLARTAPLVRTATGVATAAKSPAATHTAAFAVATTSGAATCADAAPWDSAAARAPPERATPRRDSRSASSLRPAARRRERVPSGSFSWRAASRRDCPCRSHSTPGPRNFSGRRPSSSSSRGSQSWASSGWTSGCGSASTCFSRARRRARLSRTCRAVRDATPYSQLPTASRLRTDPA